MSGVSQSLCTPGQRGLLGIQVGGEWCARLSGHNQILTPAELSLQENPGETSDVPSGRPWAAEAQAPASWGQRMVWAHPQAGRKASMNPCVPAPPRIFCRPTGQCLGP